MTDSRTSKPNAVAHYNRVKAALQRVDNVEVLVPMRPDERARLVQLSLNAIQSNPALLECTQTSLVMSTMDALKVGLEPNTPMNEGDLIPFKDKGIPKAVFVPRYGGLIKLATQSPNVSHLYAHAVRENDEYSIELGDQQRLVHRPKPFATEAERGEIVGFYAVVTYTDGKTDFEAMSREQVDEIREGSRGKNSFGWTQHYEEMGRKTVIRRLAKRVPKCSRAMAAAVLLDNKAAVGEIVNITREAEIGTPHAPSGSAQEPEVTPPGGKPPTINDGKKKPPEEPDEPAPPPYCAVCNKLISDKDLVRTKNGEYHRVCYDTHVSPPPEQGREPGDDTDEIEEDERGGNSGAKGHGSALRAPEGFDSQNFGRKYAENQARVWPGPRGRRGGASRDRRQQ